MVVSDSNIVPLAGNLGSWRFWEPLLLLYCLRSVLMGDGTGARSRPDLEGVADKDPKDAFRCFVNKLSMVCDNQRGGDTVTAFAVLQPGDVEYRFASNRRSSQSLVEVCRFVTDLLRPLGKAPATAFSDTNKRAVMTFQILGKVLGFNRPRIEVYIRCLLKHLEFCVDTSATIDPSFSQSLQTLQVPASRAAEKNLSSDKFIPRGHALLQAISRLYDDETFKDFMRERTREDREQSNESRWSELSHFLGRLHSYTVAAKVFISARVRWPELFEAFEVTYIPSSEPSTDMPSFRGSAARMVERLTRDPSVHKAFREHEPRLQELGLDKEIQKKKKPSNFRPIVHAEVNLSDHIQREERCSNPTDGGGSARVRFFNESVFGRYIGSSKPTCRLCDLYFHAPKGPDMDVRKSHQNLYYNWRVPDLYREDGQQAEQARKEILESMVASIKQQAIQTIVSRLVVGGKRYDSNTTTSFPFSAQYRYDGVGSEAMRYLEGATSSTSLSPIREGGEDSGSGTGVRSNNMVDDLASTLGQVDLDSEGE